MFTTLNTLIYCFSTTITWGILYLLHHPEVTKLASIFKCGTSLYLISCSIHFQRVSPQGPLRLQYGRHLLVFLILQSRYLNLWLHSLCLMLLDRKTTSKGNGFGRWQRSSSFPRGRINWLIWADICSSVRPNIRRISVFCGYPVGLLKKCSPLVSVRSRGRFCHTQKHWFFMLKIFLRS